MCIPNDVLVENLKWKSPIGDKISIGDCELEISVFTIWEILKIPIPESK